MTYSIGDFDEISHIIEREILGSKIKNVDALKVWINQTSWWSEFALIPSVTWIGDAYHGFELFSYDQRTVHGFSDARGCYIFDTVYSQSREQQTTVYEQVCSINKRLKYTPKHNNIKYTIQIIGGQVLGGVLCQYSTRATRKRIPTSMLKANTIHR
jgi:hypothetical protein